MKANLVRIGVDQAYGGWNAPVDPATGAFVYVPIPESAKSFHPGCRRTFGEFIPALTRFFEDRKTDIQRHTSIDKQPLDQSVHLDPDFEHLTYGDDGQYRGAEIKAFAGGDILVFYAGLKPHGTYADKLMYAIIGLFIVDEVVPIAHVNQERWPENAHTRKTPHWQHDIVVRARAGQSGRLERCLPIGQWRDRAYRVRSDLLEEWGGLSVKDGFIQRSAVPPRFLKPERFYAWFKKQSVDLIARNF